MKNIIRQALDNEPNICLVIDVRKAGGVDNLTEDQALRLVKRYRLNEQPTVDPDEAAYTEAKRLMDAIRYWEGCRAEIGEAHDFGEMCGYDASGDAEALSRCNREIAACEARIAELSEAANRHARFIWGKNLF